MYFRETSKRKIDCDIHFIQFLRFIIIVRFRKTISAKLAMKKDEEKSVF